MRTIAVFALALSGCIVHSSDNGSSFDNPDRTPAPKCHEASAADGGSGGDAGFVDLSVSTATGFEQIVIQAAQGGLGGRLVDDWGLNGDPGEAGGLIYSRGMPQEPFDDTGIPDNALLIVDATGDLIATGVDFEQGLIEVDRFEVSANQELHLLGDVTIRARTLRIGSGALVRVHEAAEFDLATEYPGTSHGASAWIEAGHIELAGDLVVSGIDGLEPGDSGGDSGNLVITADAMDWRDGTIEASGGNGAHGQDVDCLL